jgi:hypothetical protein
MICYCHILIDIASQAIVKEESFAHVSYLLGAAFDEVLNTPTPNRISGALPMPVTREEDGHAP